MLTWRRAERPPAHGPPPGWCGRSRSVVCSACKVMQLQAVLKINRACLPACGGLKQGGHVLEAGWVMQSQ